MKMTCLTLLRDLTHYGPLVLLAFAYGALFGARGVIPESLADSLTYIFAAFILIVLSYRIYRLKSPANATLQFNGQTVQDVDQAHKDGYKVWLAIPTDDQHRKDYLYRLRQNGYLISDKDGFAIDAFAEFNDSVTRNRMQIKVVVDNTKMK